MSAQLLQVTTVSIGPSSGGRRWVCLGAKHLPSTSQANFDAYKHALMNWSERQSPYKDEEDPQQQFSLFVPLGNNYWLLGRAKHLGALSLGSVAFLSGIILTHNDLDHIGWAAHRLLSLLPVIDERVMMQFGPRTIDFEDASKPIRELKAGFNFGKTFDCFSLPTVMPGAENSGYSVLESVVAARADLSSPEVRPRSWITTSKLRVNGAQPPDLTDFMWVIYSPAEIDANKRPPRTSPPIAPTGKTP